MSGTALEWWQSVERNSDDGMRHISWSEFEDRCVKRFQPVASSEAAMQRLLVWRQTGNVTAYINGFQSITQQIPNALLPEATKVFMFLKGLVPTLQSHVKMMQPSTIDEAITQAERAGTINYAAQSSSGPNRDRRSFGGRTPQQPGFAGQGSRFAPIAIDNVQQENGAEGQSPVRMTVTSPTGSSDASAGIDLSYMNECQSA